MLQNSGIDFFKEIYLHKPNSILSTICSLVFNILAVSGILYLSISHTVKNSKEPLVGVMYGIVLYILLFPIAKFGMMKLMKKPEENEPLEQGEIVLNLLRGSLFWAYSVGLHFWITTTIVNSLVKTRRTSNNGLINDMIRNRYRLNKSSSKIKSRNELIFQCVTY